MHTYSLPIAYKILYNGEYSMVHCTWLWSCILRGKIHTVLGLLALCVEVCQFLICEILEFSKVHDFDVHETCSSMVDLRGILALIKAIPKLRSKTKILKKEVLVSSKQMLYISLVFA